MPRKKLYSRNPSQGEGYLEEIQSDSSLELNSRRNVCRKKLKRKIYSKENRFGYPQQSTYKKEIGKQQANSSEENRKRPSIIKIFRRIDRKAKHIYLVDDKIENNSELVTFTQPKSCPNIPDNERSQYSIYSPYDERSLKSNNTIPKSTMSKEYSIRNVETDGVELKNVSEMNAWNRPSDMDSSVTDIDQIYSKFDFWNMHGDTDSSHFPVINIDQASNKPDAWNACHDIDDLYASIIDIERYKLSTVYYGIDDLYPFMKDIEETPSRSEVCSQLLCNYSDISDSSETMDGQTSTETDVCIQQSSNNFFVIETDSDEIPSETDSLEMFNGQTSTSAVVCNEQIKSYCDASELR